jgi:hypothetical protein
MSLAVFRRTFQVELDAALACRTALVVNELHRDAVDGDEIAAGVWLELFSKRARHTVKMNEPEELLQEIRKRQRAYRREFRHMNKIDVTGAYGMPPSQKLGRPEPGESREGR